MCQRLSFPHNLDNDMMISTVVRFQDEIDCDADADDSGGGADSPGLMGCRDLPDIVL